MILPNLSGGHRRDATRRRFRIARYKTQEMRKRWGVDFGLPISDFRLEKWRSGEVEGWLEWGVREI
jgi:hypothetical protein